MFHFLLLLSFPILASYNFVQQQPKIVESFSLQPYHLGHSVVISNDGKTMAVSVPGLSIGEVFVYSWNESQQSFLKSGKLIGNDFVGTDEGIDLTEIGYALAMNGDGSTIFFSRADDDYNMGATWVFVGNSTSGWTQQGSKLVGSNPLPVSQQGSCLASSLDGNTLLVGSWTDDDYFGAAWIFFRDQNNNWIQQSSKLTILQTYVHFGTSCALSANGDKAMIAASTHGKLGIIAVFTRNSQGIWSFLEYIPNTEPLTMNQVSLSADGKTALIGISNITVGASVLEYNAQNNVWQQTALLQTDSKQNVSSVILSSDGNTAVVGTPGLDDYVGAAWVFTRNAISGMWNQNAQILIGNEAIGKSYQGFSVSISGNGDTVIFGGPNDLGGIGATRVFRKHTLAPVTDSPHTITTITNSPHTIAPVTKKDPSCSKIIVISPRTYQKSVSIQA